MPIINRNENILDYVSRHAGTMEALFALAQLNGIGITEDVSPGTELKVGPIPAYTVATYHASAEAVVVQAVSRNENMVDFVSRNAGTMEALFALAQLNGIGITEDVAAGTELRIGRIPQHTVAIYHAAAVTVVNTDLKKNQTVLDCSVQHCGTAESLFALAKLNGIGITDVLAAGDQVRTEQKDMAVVYAFARNGLDVTTGIIRDPMGIYGGIGLMGIENDFNVS